MTLRDEIARVAYSERDYDFHHDSEEISYKKADDILSLMRKALTSDDAVRAAWKSHTRTAGMTLEASMTYAITAALDAVTGDSHDTK